MEDRLPSEVFRELVSRGLIAPGPPQPLPTGNTDRSPVLRRLAWLVTAPDGRPLKLTLGPDLASIAERQTAFAADAPALVPAPLFRVSAGGEDVMAEPFIRGESLEARVTRTGTVTSEAVTAFRRVCRELAATERESTAADRQEEWAEFSSALLTLPLWSASEREALAQRVLPALVGHLTAAPPVTRWSNGDFTSANLLYDQDGELRLVDFEYARRTHFFREDGVRFLVFSPSARAQPAAFEPSLPAAGPSWHLFFWLRQLLLEAGQNTPAYLARVRPRRLAVIRRLAEHLCETELHGWSEPAAPVHHHLEEAHWLFHGNASVRLTGWCHVPDEPSRRVIATAGDGTLGEAPARPRPDVAGLLGSTALASGFELQIAAPAPHEVLHLSAVTADGVLLPFSRVAVGDLPGRGPALAGYASWAARYDPDPLPPAELPPRGPLFSVLVPVYDPPVAFLQACLDSVLAQQYPHWELRVVDDGSTGAGVRDCLAAFARRDRRVHVQRRPANGGIARATNDALAAASGDYVVLLDHDDVLRPHALLELARRLTEDPSLDLLYSDEDKISPEGARLTPFFKPAFSPEFLLGVMYPGHALCVRASLARDVGGFDPAFDGVQDYEFFLRVSERTRRIALLPRILYHWRQSPRSSAMHGNIKGDMDARQAAAVRAHLQRQGDAREVRPLGGHRVLLQATTAPAWRVHGHDGTDPLAALRAAAAGGGEEILILAAGEVAAAETDWRELAALAARPDSGLVAPVLVDAAGRVLEAGWTDGPAGARPLMRGFDATGDGYNGTLRCNREVAAVSARCCAVRRSVVRDVLGALRSTDGWFDLCRLLRRRGFHMRVCAAVRLRCSGSWRDAMPPIAGAAEADPYLNPHFDPIRGDYALACPPRHLGAAAVLRWHLDAAPGEHAPSGGIEFRGWCFGVDGRAVTVHLTAGSLEWESRCQHARPDVAAAHAGLTDGACGFSLRVRLPAGRHRVRLEARAGPGLALVIREQTVRVLPLVALRRAISAPEPQLLKYQLLAGPSHAARPLRGESFPGAPRGGDTPRLSIVTPSFNQAAFLGETIRSVLGQHAAVDYVVQDGGSSDGSRRLIEAVDKGDWETGITKSGQPDRPPIAGDLPPASRLRPPASPPHRAPPLPGLPTQADSPRLIAWESAPDRGQADAIVRGFAKTSGRPDDVMAWINSDDFYLPGALRFVADYFARHPDVDVIYGHRILVDEQSREVGRWFLPRHSNDILRLNDFVPQETLFWRRRLWDRVGGLDPSFQFAMDWDLLLRFAAAGAKIVRVPYFLACFRLHPAQKTSAAMHDVGQEEIDRLRTRAQGREIAPAELERNPRLLRYLRRSAFIEWLWSLGIRAP